MAKVASIVFITRKWAPATGGMETYSMRLTEALAELSPVEVVALKGRSNGMPPGFVALLLFPVLVLFRQLRRGQAARIVHLGDMALWPLGLLAHRSSQLVLSAHGTDVSFHRRGGLIGRLYGAYLRIGSRMLRRARVIANSAATKEMAALTGWADISVVPLASDFVAPLASLSSGRTIFFAGRMVKRKGCAWFVREVLPYLPEDITLDVAGTIWDAAEQVALENPRVNFLGPLPQAELARHFAEALCVIVPNIDAGNGEYEGFGLVAPEAAAAGGIVLASDHGGLTDAVIDGTTGILVPSGDAAAWTEAILNIAAWDFARRAAFIRRASTTSREHYCWQRVARDTLQAYQMTGPSQYDAALFGNPA